jgi:hypothetical protein
VILASFETPNFDFVALVEREEDAEAVMEAAWQEHARQYNCDPGYFQEYKEDMCISEIAPGHVLRDREEFYRPGGTS